MPNARVLQRSFAGGEISPEMVGRIDDVKYQTGLAKCRNFITKPHGPAVNRPGFAYVREVKTSAKATRLIPFTFNTTDTMVLEFGDLYIRFHSQGATLMTDGSLHYFTDPGMTPYEVVTPYVAADLFDIHYVQSADVLTLVHPNYAPRELRRSGTISWALSTINFAAPVSAPTGVSVAASSQSTPPATVETKWDYLYVVTAIASDNIGESAASSPPMLIKSNLNQTGTVNTVSWSSVAGATRYYVYKQQGGIYGYIGSTTTTSLIDDNIAPDMGRTPPSYDSVFGSTGNYPSAVSYYEQRRCLAGTTLQPQNIWMTKSGTESNMSYSLPVRDDDRIAVRVAAREANTIRHIVPLSSLVLLTSAAEWRVTSVNSDAITPSSISVKPQSYVGASNVQPEIINNQLVYCAARGGHVRELGYSWQSNGFITGDLSLRATHLFDNYTITDMAYSKSPTPLLWFISSTGKLLGLTYVPEQQVGAWHQHDTDGVFESCTVVSEGKEDVLYVVVQRTINGASKRYVERMATRQFADPVDAFFVDCGATYDGTAVTTISGLDHIEGKTVNILADGAVHPERTVTSGAIHLDIAASVVQVGLPIQADIETLPVVMQVDGYGQGRFKNVNKVWIRVDTSSSIWAGPDSANLVEAKQRTTEPYGSPPDLQTREIQVMLKPSWNDSGQVYIRQANPLPISVLAVTLEVAVGG